MIRTDDGLPFASGHALYGLSKLSVRWLRLERMHLTLKPEATKPSAPNVLKQQARFEAFVERYNQRGRIRP